MTPIEQAVGRSISAKVRALPGGGPKNSHFLVNPSASVRKDGYQNNIADEVSAAPGVNNGKGNSIPVSFNSSHRVLCIWDDQDWMERNGVITKLERAADVEFIYSYGAQIPSDAIPDFELTETEQINDGTEHETLQIFTRVKVSV